MDDDFKNSDYHSALHDGSFTHQIDPDHLADPVISTLRAGVSAAKAAWTRTLVSRRDILRDPTQTLAMNARRLAAAADRHAEPGYRVVQAAITRAQDEVKGIETATSKALEPPAPDLTMATAAMLRSMTPEQRSKAISDAIAERDEGFLAVVLWRGSRQLYGLSQAEREMWRDRYRRIAYPDAMRRMEELNKAIDKAKAAGEALLASTAAVVNRIELEEAEKLAQAAKAAE
jgi:hypothetical protein